MSKNKNLLNLPQIIFFLLTIEIQTINLLSNKNRIKNNCYSKCENLKNNKKSKFDNFLYCLQNCKNSCFCNKNEKNRFRLIFDENGFIKKISYCDYKCFFLFDNFHFRKNENFGFFNFFEDDLGINKNPFYFKSENELED